MLELQELRFKNIGRFTDEQVIDFTNQSNFVGITSLNKVTGGASGCGKSSIFNAHDYLLGLNDLPVTVLQSRLTKEGISVFGKYSWNGVPVTVQRGKSGLKMTIDGELFEGSNSLVEEKIDQILGMSREMFRKVVHKKQGERGFFLDFTPKKMYEFLIDCLSLGEMRKKTDIIESKLQDLLSQKIKLESAIVNTQSALNATVEATQAIGVPPILDIHPDTLVKLEESLVLAERSYKECLATCKIELDEFLKTKPSISVSHYDTSLFDKYQIELKEFQDKVLSIKKNEQDRVSGIKIQLQKLQMDQKDLNFKIIQADQSKQEAVKIAEQVKKIRAHSCPTCEQNWVTENAKITESNLIKKLSEYKQTIASAVLAKGQLKDLEIELKDLEIELKPKVHPELEFLNQSIANLESLILNEKNKQKTHLDSQNKSNQLLALAFETKRQDLTNKHENLTTQLRGQVDISRRTLDIAKNKAKSYEESVKRYEETKKLLQSKTILLTEELKNANVSLQDLSKEILLAEEIKKAIKMYVSYSFDGALESIGDKATEIIRNIPNMATATIEFQGVKETKEGKQKEEVHAVISTDGEQNVPIKSLSGGERSAVDLAVDLSVINFIEERTGTGIDTIILDEPFVGLGQIEIEMALEVLKNCNVNKRIIIVDHAPLVNEMVESKILVERDGLTSQIILESGNSGL